MTEDDLVNRARELFISDVQRDIQEERFFQHGSKPGWSSRESALDFIEKLDNKEPIDLGHVASDTLSIILESLGLSNDDPMFQKVWKRIEKGEVEK